MKSISFYWINLELISKKLYAIKFFEKQGTGINNKALMLIEFMFIFKECTLKLPAQKNLLFFIDVRNRSQRYVTMLD